ncbi:MAG: hypothetical protein C4K60_18280 [Ideonella sp. MAG2]|nr:MAG: hypothetical protein C4K60_18280 [Ideonella sp. MAG2]
MRELSPIEFEVVDFDSAREGWATPRGAVTPTATPQPSAPIQNWEERRHSPTTDEVVPTAEALLWFAKLPEPIRPQHLLQAFPRVLNRIAAHWAQRAECLSVLEDLLIDRRGTRSGFAAPVAEEIARLRDYRVLER